MYSYDHDKTHLVQILIISRPYIQLYMHLPSSMIANYCIFQMAFEYVVVEFTEELSVEIVHKSWIKSEDEVKYVY